jgi:hypothetical protein
MHPLIKLQGFANFLPQKRYNPLLPTYSPDLSPPDYFLFPKLKIKFKELQFSGVTKIQAAVTN